MHQSTKKFTMCPTNHHRLIGFLFIAAFITTGHCKKQGQFFKIKPEPVVQVIEGGSVVLNCKVGNQQGRVQWAKDGFLLGYDRNIPGFPRYSIFGDEKDGIHNLRIENARLEDDGIIECQVGPAENNPGIRAQTRLTVILKPTSIEISGHSNGSKVDIEQNESTTLDCIVYGGRPLAKVKWFKNLQEIRTGLNESESHSESKPSYRSSLTIKPSAVDNNAIYTCIAVHPALSTLTQQQLAILNSNLLSNQVTSSKNSHSIRNQLFSQVKLNVLYPPEPPKITGYTNTETLRAGFTLGLTCRSLGGNPQPQLIWYRNNVQIDSSYTIDAGKESVNTYTFTVDANDHNAVYKCVARTPSLNGFDYVQFPTKYLQLEQQSNHIQTTEVRLNVQYAPSNVKILGETEVKQGSLVRMRCVTSKANPPSEISWVVDGHLMNTTTSQVISAANFSLEKYISAYNRNPQPLESTTALSPASALIDDKAGYITIAEITYRVRPDERNQKTFSCYALSQSLSETVVENALLNILYPCEPPTIFNYKMGVPIRAGIQHRLSCVVHSGYPAPKLVWTRNSQQLSNNDADVISLVEMKQAVRNKTNANDKQTANTGPTSELTIKVKGEDDGAVYSCSAQNSAMDKPLVTSVQLAVQYAPSNVPIRSDPPIVEAGQSLQLSCVAAASNPPAELSWFSEGLPVTIGIANSTSESSTMRPINSSTTNQVSILKLRTTSSMNGKVFTCQATNHALQQSVHDAITLNIHFKPEFTSFANGRKVFNLIEGESTLINLTISANPPEIKNRWYREDGKQIASNRFKPEDSFLNVTNIQRTDAATYIVETANSVGTSSTSVTINVQYPPEVVKTSGTILIDAGLNAQLECEIDANPFSNSIISWRRLRTEDDQQELASLIESDSVAERQRILVTNGELYKHPDVDPAKFEVQFEQNKAILVIHNVTQADSGVYVCVANNQIGNQPANGTIQLIIKQAPTMKLLPTTIKSASDAGSVGKLSCRAQAAPNVEFTWLKNDVVISKRSSLSKSSDNLNSIDLYNSALLSNQISATSSDQLAYSEHRNPFSSNSISQLSSGGNRASKDKYTVLPIRRIGLITMESVLLINDVSPADYGMYRCKAENELGESLADVHFSKPQPPDTPIALRAVNASSVSIKLKWVPGFDGGLPQQFRLRFKKVDPSNGKSAAGYNYLDINASELREWNLVGLRPSTEYLFAIQSINDLGESEFTKDIVSERTLDELPVSEKEKVISEGVMSGQISSDLPRGDSTNTSFPAFHAWERCVRGIAPRLIIIIVSVLGSSLLFLNIILVVCFVRRRRKKAMEDDEASTSKAATIEMYGTNSNGSNNGCATETSMSGEDEEKRSQAYSSQTDYAMEIAPNGHVLNSTGLSTYLLDEGGISQMADFYDNSFFHSNVNPVQPDVTVNTHYYIEDPTYAEALRKNAINLVSNGALHSSSVEPVSSPLNSVAGTEDQSEHSLQNNNMLSTISNNTLLSPVANEHHHQLNHDSALLFGYASINSLALTGGQTSINQQQIPPMPPLRTNHLTNHHTDKLLGGGYSVGYATLAAPGSRLNNNNNNLNNMNNMNNLNSMTNLSTMNQFPPPPTMPSSIGHLV